MSTTSRIREKLYNHRSYVEERYGSIWYAPRCGPGTISWI